MAELSEDICSSLLGVGPLILLFPKPSFLLLSVNCILDFLGSRVHRSNGDIAVHVQMLCQLLEQDFEVYRLTWRFPLSWIASTSCE